MSNAAAPSVDPPLDVAVIEAAATRPPMFLGLPLRLSSLLLAFGALVIVLTDTLKWQIGVAVGIGMVWGFAKVLVASDLHGVDIWLVHILHDGKSLDADKWGGARCAALPQRPSAPYGVFSDAA